MCDPPVAAIGLSMGSAIVQQLVLDHPELFRMAVAMGTGANSRAWGWDYQEAEIEFRKAGGSLDGMMAVCHYAATMYPARALGDRELWPKLKGDLLEWIESGENEAAQRYQDNAARARKTFNERFWYDEGGYLYDVIDGPQPNDNACRPNIGRGGRHHRQLAARRQHHEDRRRAGALLDAHAVEQSEHDQRAHRHRNHEWLQPGRHHCQVEGA